MNYVVLFSGVLMNVIANVCAKAAVARLLRGGEETISLLLMLRLLVNPYFYLSAFFFGLAFLIYLLSLSRMQLSFAYPVFVSGSVVLVSLFSVIIFEDVFTIKSAIGILVIILGIFVLALR